MLPSVIRALGLAHAGRRERHTDRAEEYEARRQAIEAATERLDQLRAERHLSEDIVQPLRAQHRDRLKDIEHRSDGDDDHRRLTDLHDEIELLLIAAERQGQWVFPESQTKFPAVNFVASELGFLSLKPS
jgi:hypothetical protein